MSDSIISHTTTVVPQADPVLSLRDAHDQRIAAIEAQRSEAYADFVKDVRRLVAQSPDESLVSACKKLGMTRQSFYELERRHAPAAAG